jgi:NarL family two-component system response regulator LiaR
MAESTPIRVLLVDDHAVIHSGLGAFLLAFDDLELVGEAGSGEEAVQICARVQPDVVLMDLVMPGLDGAAATRAIRERCPGIQVIALTSFKEEDLVQRALQAGAISYLLKNVSANELAEAIRAAHAGRPTWLRRRPRRWFRPPPNRLRRATT